ncbi:hypothetical protein KY319_01915 [Candidatus Woesearchaeota archaeon]|nr:hypothetical protein [Candidatus Woesearchaeota archaeon]
MIPVYCIKVPEYQVKTKPDWTKIGNKIDKIIKKHFLGKKVAIRCLSSKEHKGKTINQLIKIIRTTGTDRYDPKRKGDRYENIEGKHIDFFALDYLIKPKTKIMQNFIEPFYTWPIKFKQKPTRVDLAIVYDFSKLKRVLHQYEGRTDIKRDGFMFKDHKNKQKAVLGIIKIL